MKSTRNQKKQSGPKSKRIPKIIKAVRPTFLQALELIPNQITFLRLLLLFPLWYTALFNYKTSFVFFFLLAGATDFLDGYLARRLRQATHFGAAFDSLVDNLICLSLLFWVYLLIPNLVIENVNLAVGLFLLLILNLSLQLWIYHRFIPLHLYSGKITNVLLYLFVAHAVIYTYSQPFLYILVLSALVMFLEEFIIVLRRKTVDEHTKTVFH